MLAEPSHVLRDHKSVHMENLQHECFSTENMGVVPFSAQYQSTDMRLQIIQ
ncbi:hypothetical protein STEG23_021595, partial [Scotinomys teguina]